MSIDDNDNYYVLQDNDGEMEEDDSPRNFAAYNIEEEDKEDLDEGDEGLEEKNVSALGLMFRIMVNPVEGWKNLRRSHIKLETLQSGCFYPLLALVAVSKFAEFFYSVNVSLGKVVTEGVIAFVAFFFGFFCVSQFLNLVLPPDMVKKFDCRFGKEYIVISMSTLALFSMLTDLLPMIWPILIFLPLWTLYIMFKGVRFFKFAVNQEMKFYIFAASAAIGMPLLIDWVLNTVLPY